MKRRKKTLFIGNIALAFMALLCLALVFRLGGVLESQKAAERWRGESGASFAQLSAFLPEGKDLSLEQIYQFRQTLETKLTEASLKMQSDAGKEKETEPAEQGKPAIPEGLDLYIDAWSSVGEVNVSGERGSSKAEVTAVGGDYFYFHPLRLLSGSYLSEADLMEDRVILDQDLAWKLFGGTDLAGMTVEIGGVPYMIAGVVERESDFATKRAYTAGGGLFMSYRAYMGMAQDAIECYEIVLPQPIGGFAETLMKDSFPLNGGELVNNSQRFSPESLWQMLRAFGTRSMQRSNVIYPYWENAARFLGDWCALAFALCLLFALLPSLCGFIWLLAALIRVKDLLTKKLPQLVSQALDKRRMKRFLRQGAHEKSKEKSLKTQ